VLNYWKREWASECSGLWKKPYYANLDGTDFFTKKLEDYNKFDYKLENKEQKSFNWETRELFNLEEDNFVLEQSTPLLISAKSIFYFDKDQEKKWEIYDSFKQDRDLLGLYPNVIGIHRKNDNEYRVVYKVYDNKNGARYFMEDLVFGDTISLVDIDRREPFLERYSDGDNVEIVDIKMSDMYIVVYTRKVSDKEYQLSNIGFRDRKINTIATTNSKPQLGF